MYRLITIFLLITLSFSPIAFPREQNNLISAPHKKEILWLIEDTFEWENYKKNVSTSTSQDTALIVMKGLDDMGYKLNFVKATGKRVNRILTDSNNACISNRIKTKAREEFSIFSFAHDIYLGLMLYRKSQLEPLNPNVLNDQGEVIDLASLFKHHEEQILAVSSGISYGSAIDKQIAYVPKKNLFERTGGTRLKSLAEMFFKGRIDYVIFYPNDMDTVINKNIDLESYKLANTPAYILGHVTCSKTTTGNAIIKDINKILIQAYTLPEFYHAHEKWLPTSDLETLREYYLQVFGQFPNNIN
jgi:uncharacterized protein (TIGR02285 family)